jgi:hypothetical protein
MIYLYVKTHQITGLKYLGKTVCKDPHAYKGSGKMWQAHCKKHGYIYNTEIIFQSDSKDAIKEKGIYYSQFWNIVESKEWANLKQEECEGGYCANSVTPEANAKRSAALKGRTISAEHRKKLSDANKGKYWLSAESKQRAIEKLKGRKIPKEVIEKAVDTRLKNIVRKVKPTKIMKPIIVCPHCGFEGKHSGNMRNYHFDNCEIIAGPRFRKCDNRKPAVGKTKQWIFLSPTNEQVVVNSLRKFCRENGLNNGSMSEVATGNRISHKGWKVVSKILYDDTCL